MMLKPGYRYIALVNKIIDGDTLNVDIDLGFHTWLKDIKIRLKGIDAPELSTPEGIKIKEWLATHIDSQITIDTIKPDKYGNRWDAIIYLSDGQNLNDLMVSLGLAKRVKE